ncbi:MAG: thioredoxin domain-containing protein [Candidatus Paceibacterota bacterium]|jgi:protein-disulfide isomerase
MENKPSFITIPGAIIIAGAIIAMTLIYVFKPSSTIVKDAKVENAPAINLAPITSADRILGNPNAPIKIVEYSDPSCPFCKIFNETMVEIMDKYGPEGKVALIYRSFPLDTPDAEGNVLHPNAANESRAIECAGILGGNEKFWEYEKKLYDLTPSVTSKTPEGLDQKQLPIMAKGLGLDIIAFNECLNSQKAKDIVSAQKLSGINANVSGTPTSFFVLSEKINPTATTYVSNALIQYRIPQSLLYVTDDKKMIVMSGAMPKIMVTGIIDSLLK